MVNENHSGDRIQSEGNDWDKLASILQTAVMVIGAGAALAGWIAVVGGARIWARFSAAELPLEAAVLQSREVLFGEGLRALALPLVLGAVAAFFFYIYARRHEQDNKSDGDKHPKIADKPPGKNDGDEHSEMGKRSLLPPGRAENPRRFQTTMGRPDVGESEVDEESPPGSTENGDQRSEASGLATLMRKYHVWVESVASVYGRGPTQLLEVLLLILMGLTIALIIVSRVTGVEFIWLVCMLAASILVAFGLFVAVGKQTSPTAASVTIFFAVAVWSGVLGYLAERGAQSPDFELAVAVRKNQPPITGSYVSRSSSHIYLAKDLGSETKEIIIVPLSDLVSLHLGPSALENESDKEQGERRERMTAQAAEVSSNESQPRPSPSLSPQPPAPQSPGSSDELIESFHQALLALQEEVDRLEATDLNPPLMVNATTHKSRTPLRRKSVLSRVAPCPAGTVAISGGGKTRPRRAAMLIHSRPWGVSNETASGWKAVARESRRDTNKTAWRLKVFVTCLDMD